MMGDRSTEFIAHILDVSVIKFNSKPSVECDDRPSDAECVATIMCCNQTLRWSTE